MAKNLTDKSAEIQPRSAAVPKSGRTLVLGISAAALAAGLALPSGPAKAVAPVPSLAERVNAARAMAQASPAVTDELLRENGLIKAQWVNWPNWGSGYVPWNNWHNWHNWGNGFWGNF